MRSERNTDVRVDVAIREATEFGQRIRVWGWKFGSVGTILLTGLAFAGLPTAWLIVVSFGMIVVLITQAHANIAKRNTAALSYVEQMCVGMDERLERIHADTPTP